MGVNKAGVGSLCGAGHSPECLVGRLHSAFRAAPFGKRHRDYSKRDAASLKLWKITEKWCHLAALSILGVIKGLAWCWRPSVHVTRCSRLCPSLLLAGMSVP